MKKFISKLVKKSIIKLNDLYKTLGNADIVQPPNPPKPPQGWLSL